MSTIITIEQAQAKLPDLIDSLKTGDEIVITKENEPVAKLVAHRPVSPKPRTPGNCKDMIRLAVEDDEHLRDFAEYEAR
jgi:prevent-host-death family protein